MDVSEPRALSELLGLAVVDQSGRHLGRVCEAKARWQKDGSLVVDELILGRSGLLRRLRGPGREGRTIPWNAIVRLENDRVVAIAAAPASGGGRS